MKTRAASTRRARSDGKGKREEGEGKNTQRSTLNAQLSIDEHRYLTQPEAHPANYIGEANVLAGLFGLDEAAIAAKIAEGAADGDD